MLILFLLFIGIAARAGIGSFLNAYALATSQIDPASSAVSLSPNNPDTHLTRGALLEVSNDVPSAIPEYEEAVSLRAQDYVLWLALARACELNGDATRAIAAGRQAVKLAPYYAEPHWQLGNILLRAGERDEGFKELTAAASSDSSLLPGIIDLAWHLSNGDAETVEQQIAPHTAAGYRALAFYFRQRGNVDEAITMYKSAGSEAESEIGSYVGELISAKRFPEAFTLWRVIHNAGAPGVITDAGFEEERDLTEPGFGWRSVDKSQRFNFSLDSGSPREGRFSLKVDFTGDSDPNAPILSQMVLVQPLARYELRFSVRSENLISGGLPIVIVLDTENGNPLGKSEQFPRTITAWREYTIDFQTGSSTTAIQIALQREGCNPPCPIFGRIWLDGFFLRKL